MLSDTETREEFICYWCHNRTCRIVARGKTKKQQAGPGEAANAAYACTSRLHGRFFQVVECTNCHLRTLFPLPPAATIIDAYASVTDENYFVIEPARTTAFTKLLQRLEKDVPPPAKLLDIGCYTGLFPYLAQQRGYEAYGIEPSAWASAIAQRRLPPGRIHHGCLDTANVATASFDLISAWDVIEHVTDPKKEIELMADLLKPGGWLVMSTMASDALLVKILGARWPWYMPMHVFYFTPTTLRPMLQGAGLHPRQPELYPHYTTIQYLCWKLEPMFGSLARMAAQGARKLHLEQRVIKVDLRDFFLIAAQKNT